MSNTKGKYQIWHRTWWKEASSDLWPNGLEPEMGTKYIIGYADTKEEARIICSEWNKSHKEGRYSDRAEFSSSY
jgi:hypothetical protein